MDNFIIDISNRINELQYKKNIVIAVDGRCASGKTTLADKLKKQYSASVIHMDDFFLPSDLRNEKRFNETGGNIHYERFFDEVVNGIRSGKDFCYRVFDCGIMDYSGFAEVKTTGVIIIEGCYSMRPEFRDLYDFTIFTDVEKSEQKRRIINRNGEQAYRMFEERWIPLEEKYFIELNIEEYCDLTFPLPKLCFCPEESKNADTTENIYIEGDSLDALKLLREKYANRIKTIYIDPPYNTGNEFVYSDKFSNNALPCRWSEMMRVRLQLTRDLMTENGALFISIDDNELHNLRFICDEVFGSRNYINTVTVKTKTGSGASGGGEDKRLKKNTEFLLIYAKNKNTLDLRQPYKYVRISDFITEHKKNNIGFYYTRIIDCFGVKKLLKEQDGVKIYEHHGFRFSTVAEKQKQEGLSVDEVYSKYFDKIFMVTNAQTSLLVKANAVTPNKQMLVSYEYVPKTGRKKGKKTQKYVWNKTLVVWLADSALKNKDGVFKTEQIGTLWNDISWGRLDLEGNVPFKNGKKPLKLIERIIKMSADKDGIILDFFSGSATTAHAVMRLNAEDGGRRKFIMIQLPELCGEKSDAFKAGYKNICEIGKARIRYAEKEIEKSTVTGEKYDTGFKVYKI